MVAFVVKRFAAMVVIMLFLIAAVFTLQHISKVDPARAAVGEHASQKVVEAEEDKLGLNDPLPTQFIRYVGNVATGNLQTSLRTHQPVISDLGEFLPASLELIFVAILFAVPMALFFGISAAARWKGSGGFRLGALVLAAAPPFVLGILALILFYQKLGWLPASGRTEITRPPGGPTGFLMLDGLIHGEPNVTWDAFKHLILPGFALALLPAVAVGRTLRGGIITNLRADHVRVARAKGLTNWQVLRHHTLRNAAGPALAMSGLMVGLMFASLAVVERVFSFPGIGLYLDQSLPLGDFPAIAGVTLLFGISYVVVNTIVDILQAAADPRIRS